MSKRKLNRELRKELLRLQSEQFRRELAQECRVFAPLWQSSDAAAADSAQCGSGWLGKASLLATILLPSRWRKWVTYGLALGQIALVFSRKSR